MAGSKPKIDKVEKDRRIRIVQEWLLQDYPYQDVVKNICVQWNIEIRQAKRYIHDARLIWQDEEQPILDAKRRQKIDGLKALKRKMEAKLASTPAGIRAILAVEKEIIKLEGLYPALKPKLVKPDEPEKPAESSPQLPAKLDMSLLTESELQAIVALSKKAQSA